jgi:hypothetical protein
MNAALFRRLVWKEYRVMRGFWLALAVFAGMGFLAVRCLAETPGFLNFGMWGVAALVPALYALGCGATLFAVEREEETYDFLRSLPCTSAQLFIGKLTFAVVSSMALVLGLVLLAAIAVAWQPPRDGLEELAAVYGVGMVEVLVWGTLFSLLTHRALHAAVLAAATAIGVPAVSGVFGFNMPDPEQAATFAAFAPWRLCVVAAVFLVDVWIGVRWLRAPSRRRRRISQWTDALARWWSARAARALAAKRRRPRKPGWLTSFGRLVWHEWRQARALGLTLAGAAAALIFTPRSDPDMITLALLPLALMGGCVFQADQRGEQFRFFAERGISPRTVWLSRQTIWLTMLLLTPLLLMFVDLCIVWQTWQAVPLHRSDSGGLWLRGLVENLRLVGLRLDIDASHRAQHLRFNFDSSYVVGGCLVLAMTYSAGQLASMYIRRGIIACFGGLWLAGMLFAWTGLMLMIRAPWTWSIAPIPLALLFATWLRAPDWLLERKDWRARTRAAASLLVPVASLFAAVAVFRVEQIPYIAPSSFSAPAPTREALETTAMYRRAYDELTAARRAGWEPDWGSFEPVERALSLAVDASLRDSCVLDLHIAISGIIDLERVQQLASISFQNAKTLQEEGNLDDAFSLYFAVLRMAGHLCQQATPTGPVLGRPLERSVFDELPRWAAGQGQTPERVREAIGKLANAVRPFPSLLEALDGEWESLRELIAADPATWPVQTDEDRWARTLWRWMPWERTRARRLLEKLAQEEHEGLFRVEMALKGGNPVAPVLFVAHDEKTLEYAQTTIVPNRYGGSGSGLASLEIEMETRRRATELVLVLMAFRLENGKLPAMLDELGDVGRVHDPYTGEPFHYFRDGLSSDLVMGAPENTVLAGVPLVWSPGPWIGSQISNRLGQTKCLEDRAAGRLFPNTKGGDDVNSYGLVFALPAGP